MMQVLENIRIINNDARQDVLIEWQGTSTQYIQVNIKYQKLGMSGWGEFMTYSINSSNQLVSFHRSLNEEERGIYSFLFSCYVAGQQEECASYKVEHIMLGRKLRVRYQRVTERGLSYVKFTDIDRNEKLPAEYFYIQTGEIKYPIGFDIVKGVKVALPEMERFDIHCITPYNQMYELIND